jgi:enoyl-[acyl-carrier-protein] reductase (NADH)
MARMVQLDELTGPATFLASEAASACTGIDLVVDGGFVCW